MVGFSVGFAVEPLNGVGLAGVGLGLGLRLILLGLLWLGFRWWWFFDPCRSGGNPRPSLPPGVAVPDPFWLVTGIPFCKERVTVSIGQSQLFVYWSWLLKF